MVRRVSLPDVRRHRGEIVEEGDADTIFERPQRAYTQRLLAAVPEVSAKDREARRAILDEEKIHADELQAEQEELELAAAAGDDEPDLHTKDDAAPV